MPIDTSSAAAVVRFSGLGVLRFNRDRTLAENLFLHEAGHTVTVEIFKPLVARLKTFFSQNPEEATGLATFRRFPDDNEPCPLYKRVAVYEDIDVSQMDTNNGPLDVCIDVSGEGYTERNGVETFEPAPFDRLAGEGDENDFRWIVNVTAAGLLGTPVPTTAQNSEITTSVPTTRLKIRNAEFYTHSRAANGQTPYVYQQVEDVLPGGPRALSTIRPFGMINDEIGARIDAEKVRVEVTIGTEAHTHILPKLEMPYVIYIKNNAAVSGSDMPIYKKLYETTGPTFDLLTNEELGLMEGSSTITGREFCAGIFEEFPPGF
jgi:hypothetical protein